MQQAFKTFTQQMNTQNSPFGNTAFSPGSPFPFPPPAGPPSAPSASQPMTVDVHATQVKEPPSAPVKDQVEPVKVKVEPENVPKKYGSSKPLMSLVCQICYLTETSLNLVHGSFMVNPVSLFSIRSNTV